jgi:hypothetical protein
VQVQRVVRCEPSPCLTETVEEIPKNLVGRQEPQKRATAYLRKYGEQRRTVGVATLAIERKERDPANMAGGNTQRSCAPAPQLEDGEGKAPTKLPRDSSTQRTELGAC